MAIKLKSFAVSTKFGDPYHIEATSAKKAAEEFVEGYDSDATEVIVFEQVAEFKVDYKTVLTEVK